MAMASSVLHHNQAQHLLIRQENKFSYVLLPSAVDETASEGGGGGGLRLCFADHAKAPTTTPAAAIAKKNNVLPAAMMEQCCVREEDHIHAHVHHGEIIEDILLEECMEGAGCALPLLWDYSRSCIMSDVDVDTIMAHGNVDGILEEEEDPLLVGHVHEEGCGHEQIIHGDHVDWLVPMSDGSFVLRHRSSRDDEGDCNNKDPANVVDVGKKSGGHVVHGRLVKIGESRGRSRKCTTKRFFDLFQYQQGPCYQKSTIAADNILLLQPPRQAAAAANSDQSPPLTKKHQQHQEQQQLMIIPIDLHDHGDGLGSPPSSAAASASQKTVLDVLGICCPAEVPLLHKLLEPIPGVHDVSVNVAMKTVTVHHDPMINKASLVKVLNGAQLEASVHVIGEWKAGHRWPSPYVFASGFLLALAFFSYVYHPLKWLAIGAVVVGIPPMLRKACISLRRFILDVNVLMLIAVSGAIGLGDYLEAGSIVFLFTIAEWLESKSTAKARLAISSVAKLAPQEAVLAETEQRVPVAEVKVGTRISVKAGESIPIDGLVVSGASAVDESSLTGESFPVEKEVGGQVWAGTINLTGYLCVETSALAEDTAVARMVRLVEDAQNQRTQFEMLVEKCAKIYTPTVMVVAVAVMVIPAMMHAHHLRHWLYTALVLLVIACPCALVISTPIATTCALAQAARTGLIVKGGKYLEALGKMKLLAVDKTGTLTEGYFQVVDMHPLKDPASLQQLLHWVSSIESKASHPMASAIVEHARLHGAEPNGIVDKFQIVVGEGVSGEVDGHEICVGNERLVKRMQWAEDAIGQPSVLEGWRNQGFTICWVSVDGVPHSVFSVGDQLRKEAVEAVGILRRLGLRIAMLTGDSQASANIVQSKLGEVDVYARCLPEDKVEVIRQLKGVGRTGMVGDGINDAPALATADVGIAMGVAGTAIAIETADIALMTNDLRQLATAVKLGRKTQTKIKLNIALSIATKLMVIVLSAVGYAYLWLAIVTDVGTCLVVIFNSMLLLEGHPRKRDPNSKSTSAFLGLLRRLLGHNIGHHHGHNDHHHHHHHDERCGSHGGGGGKKCAAHHGHDIESGSYNNNNDCEEEAKGCGCEGANNSNGVRRRVVCCGSATTTFPDSCCSASSKIIMATPHHHHHHPNNNNNDNCCQTAQTSNSCCTPPPTAAAAAKSPTNKGGCCSSTNKTDLEKKHHHHHQHQHVVDQLPDLEHGHGEEAAAHHHNYCCTSTAKGKANAAERSSCGGKSEEELSSSSSGGGGGVDHHICHG